jgi:enoyl-CoA hydratase/3-hydroxyacyl-CoA dehydrogenase
MEESTMAYETIAVAKDTETGVATLTLNRPDRLNTINPQMTDEVERALIDLDKDESVRCLLITGAGEKAFSAGADVTSFGGVTKSYVGRDLSRRTQHVFSRLAEFPKPTVAAINGYCFGGGLEMALACDFRLAAKGAKIGQTELNLGLITGAGGSPRLVRLLGLARAKEIVLLAQRFTADEAHRLGIVTQVVENDAFRETARQFAAKLARSAPIAYRLAKAVLNQSGDMSLHAALEAESTAFGHVLSTEDIYEGIQAMMEKRDPKFKGQ